MLTHTIGVAALEVARDWPSWKMVSRKYGAVDKLDSDASHA